MEIDVKIAPNLKATITGKELIKAITDLPPQQCWIAIGIMLNKFKDTAEKHNDAEKEVIYNYLTATAKHFKPAQ